MNKKRSKRKKASSLTRKIPLHRISVVDTEHEVGPAYHITPKKVWQVYRAMRKGRSFSASKRVLWRNRHRLVLRRDSSIATAIREKEYYCPEPPEEREDPQWLEMGHEYPSDCNGDGPHSSEEYDPENDANRKRKHLRNKKKQKYRKKRRRNSDGRSKEYDRRSQRRQAGDIIRNLSGDIKRKAERRQPGDINRSGETKS